MRFGATTAAVIAIGAASVAQAGLVNGGFEGGTASYYGLGSGSTAITGWTTTDSGVEWFLPSAYGYANSPAGGYAVDIANYTFSAGGIGQTFATSIGTQYRIDFYFGTQLGSGRDGTAEIEVAAGSTSQMFSIASATGPIGWFSKSFVFTADSASTTLSFRCLQNANLHFAYIDGVSDVVIPAPGSAAGVLLAGTMAAARRRR